MRWTDGERGPSFKKSEINRHLPKIEVRHMRKASDPKAPSPLPSFVVRTYQLGSLEFLPLSSTLSAADARRRRPFAHLLKVSWVLSGSSWSTKILAPTTGSWDLGQISSTMESTQSSARSPSRLTYKEASGMAATLSMLEDIGALHAALKISAENDKDQLL